MIGIVADDITGANDIGIMYAKSGLETHVYPMDAWQSRLTQGALAEDRPDVLVIDTNSRLDSAAAAYDKVFRTTRSLQAAGCTRFINKTCSVFRGNIGAEFDAMLDALNASFAVIVLGFPKNGRTTIGGVHYVRGQRLEASEFRNDPVHPMKESNLVDILQKQTKRKVDYVHIHKIEQGSDALRHEIAAKRAECQYLILDVRNQDSLRIIAEAVQDEPVLCGSSALAEELAALNRRESSCNEADQAFRGSKAALDDAAGTQTKAVESAAAVKPDKPSVRASSGVLCAAGSLMPQTTAQIEYVIERGIFSIELDTVQLMGDRAQTGQLVQDIVNTAVHELQSGKDVLIYTSRSANKAEETKERGRQMGLSLEETSRIVSGALAGIVKAVTGQTGQRRLLVAGGETSAAVCRELGIGGLRILEEIEPGLPSCSTLLEPSLLLVLKSGSFGGADFFEKAVDHLNNL